MKVEPFCEHGPGGGPADNPYFMVGVAFDRGRGLAFFVRRGRAIDPGPELAAFNFWLGNADLLVTVERGRLLPRISFQWNRLRPRPA